MIKLISLLTFCIVLSACSTADQTRLSVDEKSDVNVYQDFITNQQLLSVNKVTPFNYERFMILDEQHVLVSSWNKKHYLLATSANCEDIRFAKKLTLLRHDDNAIDSRSDKIVRVGDKYEPCDISHIYKVHQVQFETLRNMKIETDHMSNINDTNYHSHRNSLL